MNDRASLQAELLLLCGKVRDHTLTPGDAARLDELLQADESARLLFVRYLSLVSLLESHGMGQRVAREQTEHREEIDHSLFEELAMLEDQAEAEVVEQTWAQRRSKTKKRQGRAGRNKQRTLVLLGAVVVCVIALAVFFVLRDKDSQSSVAEDPNQQARSISGGTEKPSTPKPLAPAEPVFVATLTAQYMAVWDGADMPIDTALLSGQRLSLVAGFAEITTRHNAVVLIEGPAQFELIDKDSAIYLETGKLVGFNSPESDQPLVVRALYGKAIAHGAELGVSAERKGMEVTVFSGNLSVQTPEGASRVLQANETVRMLLDIDRSVISLRERAINAYTRQLPTD